MLDMTFTSLYGTTDSTIANVTTSTFLICTLASILLGLLVAAIYMFRHKYSKNFVITLALLPLIVQMVITLVNGNLGAGIAVMGVFNLVRFRSIPGSAKDISSVFLAMAIGLATGMGFLTLAFLFAIIVAITNMIFVMSPLGNTPEPDMILKVTVPEDANYHDLLEEPLSRYTSYHELRHVQSSNMGSLYQLEYVVRLRQANIEKDMIDDIRCLNGNLKVSFGLAPTERRL